MQSYIEISETWLWQQSAEMCPLFKYEDQKSYQMPSMLVNTCNPSVGKTETRGALVLSVNPVYPYWWSPGQWETLFQKTSKGVTEEGIWCVHTLTYIHILSMLLYVCILMKKKQLMYPTITNKYLGKRDITPDMLIKCMSTPTSIMCITTKYNRKKWPEY